MVCVESLIEAKRGEIFARGDEAPPPPPNAVTCMSVQVMNGNYGTSTWPQLSWMIHSAKLHL